MVSRALRSNITSPPVKPGDRTRDQLFEAAGEVFAAKGYDRATSREICDRAGANAAAVNYYFGGFDGLYAATLAHAHHRVIQLETLSAIASSDIDARLKLRAVLASIVRLLLEPTSWEVRLLGREIASPTPSAQNALFETEILPKVRLIRVMIGELIGCDPDDPTVGRALLTTVAPCIFLALVDRAKIERILPAIADPLTEAEAVVDHFQRFILAGLDAVALNHRQGASR